MTREEAIHVLQREKDYVQQSIQKTVDGNGYVSPDGLIRADDYVGACTVAISALCDQQEQERNDPLALDELRQMDGEPVWVSVSNNWRESGVSEGWCLVRFHSEDDRVRVYIYDTRHGARFFAQQDYGISWFAYRRKPEEGTA